MSASYLKKPDSHSTQIPIHMKLSVSHLKLSESHLKLSASHFKQTASNSELSVSNLKLSASQFEIRFLMTILPAYFLDGFQPPITSWTSIWLPRFWSTAQQNHLQGFQAQGTAWQDLGQKQEQKGDPYPGCDWQAKLTPCVISLLAADN